MKASTSAGFTLTEILIVLVILGIVMGTVVGKVLSGGDKAKANLTDLQMRQLQADIEQYRLRYNTLPKSLQDLAGCTENTGQGCIPISDESSLKDAWGTGFLYSNNGNTYKIQSLGADAKTGGEAIDYDRSIEGP